MELNPSVGVLYNQRVKRKMPEDNFKLYLLLGLLVVVGASIVSDIIERQNLVSVNSVIKMSCDELHTNFNLCRQHSNTETWDYCASVYLPLYYEKCDEENTDSYVCELTCQEVYEENYETIFVKEGDKWDEFCEFEGADSEGYWIYNRDKCYRKDIMGDK